MEKKVYDYSADKVKTQIVEVFRSRRNEATVADVIASTGLPKVQVDEQLPAIADEFGARLKVTQSGEMLYSFPEGFKSRYRGFVPGLKRFWKRFKTVGIKVGTAVFKVWIVVMLIGYFVLFLAIALIALLVSMAASVAGNSSDSRSSRDDGGGIMGFMIAGRLFQFFMEIWFYSAIFDELDGTADARRYAKRQKKRRPIHQAIFSFVFGDGDPNADRDALERRVVIEFLRSHKGIITTDEFMAITGRSDSEAEKELLRYMVEFEGEPRVSDEGTIYYAFDAVMRGKYRVERPFDTVRTSDPGVDLPYKKERRFSINPTKSNVWYGIFNGVNILFGSYFLYNALTVGSSVLAGSTAHVTGSTYLYAIAYVLFGQSLPLVTIVLGVVPVVFAILFYLIPALRYSALKTENEKNGIENLRRDVNRYVLANPQAVVPAAVPVSRAGVVPRDPEKAREALVAALAAARGADIAQSGGATAYAFTETARSRADIAKVRAGIDTARFDVGGTVFDSGTP
jgi:hypothetical protein